MRLNSDDLEGRPQRATLSALTLLAAADFIVDFGDGRRNRGDHSSHEADRSRRKALQLSTEAGVLCSRMRHFTALARAPDDNLVSDVHLFELLRAANACNSRLRQLHQTLMVLYPDVAAELVESVRLATIESDALADPMDASLEVWNGALSETTETLSTVRTALAEPGG